jgi:hypothetical protein
MEGGERTWEGKWGGFPSSYSGLILEINACEKNKINGNTFFKIGSILGETLDRYPLNYEWEK